MHWLSFYNTYVFQIALDRVKEKLATECLEIYEKDMPTTKVTRNDFTYFMSKFFCSH